MSEHNEQLPLTRRERRLREMGETGAMDLSEVAAASEEATPVAPASPEAPAGEEIEISPVNADGSPRSRREMRQLREEALAARPEVETAAVEAEAVSEPVEVAPEPVQAVPEVEPVEAAPEVAAEPVGETPEVTEPEVTDIDADAVSVEAVEADVVEANAVEIDAVEADPAEVTTETVVAEIVEPEVDAGENVVPDFDTLIAPPTEPFTVEELREASRAAEQAAAPVVAEAEGEAAAEDADASDPEVSGPDSSVAVAPEAPVDATGSKSKRRFPWNRNKDAGTPVPVADEGVADAVAAPAEAAVAAPVEDAPTEAIVIDEDTAAEIATDTVTSDENDVDVDAAVIEDLSVDAEVVEATPVDNPIVADDAPEMAPAEHVASEGVEPSEAAPKSASTGYSFPDIVPPEEWRSVFDDPASRQAPNTGQGAQAGGDFDDLISRAVAQEGAAGGSNTSALILPAMPDDTGGLSGPLGGTGELYLTGSIELPKSLGETGGHSALHDSIEMDPILGHDPAEAQVTGDHGPAPVSARHAVSARVPSSIPVVAKPTKERSKLPLVLSLTGGGLLVAVVGLGVWGASNGMFG